MCTFSRPTEGALFSFLQIYLFCLSLTFPTVAVTKITPLLMLKVLELILASLSYKSKKSKKIHQKKT